MDQGVQKSKGVHSRPDSGKRTWLIVGRCSTPLSRDATGSRDVRTAARNALWRVQGRSSTGFLAAHDGAICTRFSGAGEGGQESKCPRVFQSGVLRRTFSDLWRNRKQPKKLEGMLQTPSCFVIRWLSLHCTVCIFLHILRLIENSSTQGREVWLVRGYFCCFATGMGWGYFCCFATCSGCG